MMKKQRIGLLLMGLFSAAALTSLFDSLLLSEVVSLCVQNAMFRTSKRVVFSGTGG